MKKQSKYDKVVLPKLQYIVHWAEIGMTNDQIAKSLNMARSTFQKYLATYPDFKDAVQGSKDIADKIVENALFESAVGHYKVIRKPFKVKTTEFDDGGKKVIEREEFVQVDEEQYIPPVTLAQLAWLKNRQPDRWNDKLTIQHQGGMNISIEEILAKSQGDEY